MKLSTFGVPTYVVAGVVIACAAPAVTLNVWPRVEAMLTHGFSSNELGIVMLVTISALGMTAVPFAMQKSVTWGFWATCLTFGIALAILNYVMAVGAIGKLSDHATAQTTTLITKAESLKGQLEELRAARRELGTFRPTTPEMLSAADEAVRLAQEARDQECGKVGDYCRSRVAQLQSRLSERAEVAGALALTNRKGHLDLQLTELQTRVYSFGVIPAYADPQAERIRSLLLVIWPGIATPTVANGIIHMLAICAELFALGMPRILVAALGRAEGPQAPMPLRIATPTVARISASKTPVPRALPAPAKQLTGVGEWMALHLVPKRDSRVKCWDAWKAFEKQATAPSSFTAFDYELQQLGVKKETGSRSFYLDVILKR